MDSTRPSGLLNKEQYAYIENTLSELERNHLNHCRAGLTVSGALNPTEDVHQGTVWHRRVEVIRSNTSVLKRFLNYFTAEGRRQRKQNREAATLFCRQVWVLLQNDKTSVYLKKKIINTAESGALPFLKKTEIETIIRNKEIILRSTKEREIIRNTTEFLKKELPDMLSRLPRVTVEDSREVLTAYYQLIILSPELLPKGHKAHQAIRKLEKHFRNTRQADDITKLKTNIARSVFHNLWEMLPLEDFQRLLTSIESKPRSQRGQVLRNVQNLIMSNDRRREAYSYACPREFQPVKHGHSRELVTVSDLALLVNSSSLSGCRPLSELFHDLANGVSALRHRINQLPDELRNLDLARVKEDFERYEKLLHSSSADYQSQDFKELKARCQVHRRLIAEGRAALLDIQLHPGRCWTLNLILRMLTMADANENEDKRLDRKLDQQMFQKLLDLEQLTGPQVDLAQLDWMIEQHNKAHKHPNVAIEGNGPTGLMLAFTQFQEGANVSVFERRTEDNRIPMVRLDRQWMDMLKFYLGEKYYELFGEDGFGEVVGEIATHWLEEALNKRLDDLNHRLDDSMTLNDENTPKGNDRQKASLERLAAYEMRKLEFSEQGFTVEAQYHPENDPFASGNKHPYQNSRVLSRPVDLVICAKNSQISNIYMLGGFATDRKFGVCTWEGLKDEPLQYDTPPGTSRVLGGHVVVDQEFQQFFQDQMTLQVEMMEGLSSEERLYLSQQILERSDGVCRLKASTLGRVMGTGCFENNNLVSIRVNLPEEFNEFCQKIEKKLSALPVPEFDQKGGKRSAAEQQAWRDQRAARVQKALYTAWFQTVAHSYGIEQSLGVVRTYALMTIADSGSRRFLPGSARYGTLV